MATRLASQTAVKEKEREAAAGEITVYLATPRGFCAGVERAIDIVERALFKFGAPVYVRHEIVHNQRVVSDLRAKGAVFVEDLEDVPTGAVTIFSAHGVSRLVENEAKCRKLEVIDATCPLVSKVHMEGRRYAEQGYDVVLIGHRNHVEVEGTLGQIDGPVHVVANADEVKHIEVADPNKVAYVTQTTLSVTDTKETIEALKKRFPKIVGPNTNDICYATQNRQMAVRDMLDEIELLLVVGAQNSSNSNRLREIGAEAGIPSYLIAGPDALDPSWINGAKKIGVTAGASAPESSVQETLDQLRSIRNVKILARDGIVEDIRFKLPPQVAKLSK